MHQTKISFEENHIKFLNRYSELGFKDKSSLVRSAVEEFQKSIEILQLKESAEIYKKQFIKNRDLRNLTDHANEGWPE